MDGLILLASAVLVLRVGLAMYLTGLTRAKNAAAAVARAVADLAVATLAAFVVGGMVVGLSGGEGTSVVGHLTGGPTPLVLVFSLVLLAPVATGAAVGPVAERSRFAVVLVTAALLAAVVAPVLFVWARAGWLQRLGFVDVGGACWLHVAGGAVGLVGAKLVGPRDNKYHRDGSASVIPGHHLPLAGFGTLLAFAGLVGLHGCACGGGLAAVNTALAGAAGALAALGYSHLRYGKPDVLLLLAGLLGGAVSVSALNAVGSPALPGLTTAQATITVLPVWAILAGGVGGVLVSAAAVELDLRFRVDDPTNAVAIHLVGGAWAAVVGGVLGRPDLAGIAKGLGAQVLGLAVTLVVAGGLAVAALKLLGGRLRSSENDEFDGLDLAEHDVGAYPDFQQNSIKSYHLREA